MKKIILLSSAILLATFFVACDAKTELQFASDTNSSQNINIISWRNGETQWEKPGTGYAPKDVTDAKEVSTTTGTVDCQYLTAGGYVSANIDFVELPSGGNALSLKSGATNKYTFKATP